MSLPCLACFLHLLPHAEYMRAQEFKEDFFRDLEMREYE